MLSNSMLSNSMSNGLTRFPTCVFRQKRNEDFHEAFEKESIRFSVFWQLET